MYANGFISNRNIFRNVILTSRFSNGEYNNSATGSYSNKVYTKSIMSISIPDNLINALKLIGITSDTDITTWCNSYIPYIANNSEFNLTSPLENLISWNNNWTEHQGELYSGNLTGNIFYGRTYLIQGEVLTTSNSTLDYYLNGVLIGSSEVTSNTDTVVSLIYKSTILSNTPIFKVNIRSYSSGTNSIRSLAVFDVSNTAINLSLLGYHNSDITKYLNKIPLIESNHEINTFISIPVHIPMDTIKLTANGKSGNFINPNNVEYITSDIFNSELSLTNSNTTKGKFNKDLDGSLIGNIFTKSNLTVDISNITEWLSKLGIISNSDKLTWCNNYIQYFTGTKKLSEIINLKYITVYNKLNNHTYVPISNEVYDDVQLLPKGIIKSIHINGLGSYSRDSDAYFDSSTNGITGYNNASLSRIPRITDSPIINHNYNLLVSGSSGIGIKKSFNLLNEHLYIIKFIAFIPSTVTMSIDSSNLGTNSKLKWISKNTGSGIFDEYTILVKTGIDSSSSLNPLIFTGSSIKIYIVYFNMYDITDMESVGYNDLYSPKFSVRHKIINVSSLSINDTDQIFRVME